MTTNENGHSGSDDVDVDLGDDTIPPKIAHDEDELPLDGRGAKLLLPGGSLVIHAPLADGVVVLKESWATQIADKGASGTIHIQYRDPGDRVLQAFVLPGLSVLLNLLAPHEVETV